MSPMKEPRYFTTIDPVEVTAMPPVRGRAEYLRLFQGAKDAVAIGEASVTYLRDPDTPERIRDAVPGARIIMLLRDPVERAFSNYLMHIREGWQTLPFAEALRTELYLTEGFYARPVKKYLDTFGSTQVKILIFEEWVSDPKATVEEILRFLGLNQIITDFESEPHNPYVAVRGPLAQQILASKTVSKITKNIIPRTTRAIIRDTFFLKKNQPKPKMDQESKEILVKFYHDDVQKLQTILGRKLPWPNF